MTGLQRFLDSRKSDAERWQVDGACRGQDTAVFFAPDGERRGRREQREAAAKALCASCPVRLACQEHALSVREPYGVWGGLSERERDRLVTEGRRRALERLSGVEPPGGVAVAMSGPAA